MRKLTLLIFYTILVNLGLSAGIYNDTTFLNINFQKEFNNQSKVSNSVFNNCRFIQPVLDSTRWNSVEFRSSFFDNSEYVRNATLNDYHFIDGTIKDLSLYKCILDSVFIENSVIKNLEFHNCQINNLIIKNCSSTIIKFRDSSIRNTKIIGGEIESLNVIDSKSQTVEIGHIVSESILFKSGVSNNLQFVNLNFSTTSKVEFIETRINYPKILKSDISKIDFTRAIFDFKTFQLMNDYQSDLNLFSKDKSKSVYLEARDTYYLLHKQFQNAGIYSAQRKFEFLMQEAYYKSKEKSFSTFFSMVWHKYFRGHYGLSPGIVIITTITIWLIFSIVYIILGQFTNVAWALYLPLDVHGTVISGIQPRFINQTTWDISFIYIKYCFLFSLQQLLMPSFSKSGLSFIKGIGFSQNILIPIGIGRLFSFIQYILGLVLLFNFIQAFIRIL